MSKDLKHKKFSDLVAECLPHIEELFPWDLSDRLERAPAPILLDIREPAEFTAMHIENSLNVPRGILESTCDWGYDETIPELVRARDDEIIVICRSGNRSALAALTMQMMGFSKVFSLKTGLRGWNEFEQPLIDHQGQPVDIDYADEFFAPKVRPDQLAQ